MGSFFDDFSKKQKKPIIPSPMDALNKHIQTQQAAAKKKAENQAAARNRAAQRQTPANQAAHQQDQARAAAKKKATQQAAARNRAAQLQTAARNRPSKQADAKRKTTKQTAFWTPMDVLNAHAKKKQEGWSKNSLAETAGWSEEFRQRLESIAQKAQENRIAQAKAAQEGATDRRSRAAATQMMRDALYPVNQPGISTADKLEIQKAKALWDKGDQLERQGRKADGQTIKAAAHTMAEQIRWGRGFSGGESGSDYLTPEVTNRQLHSMSDEGLRALRSAKLFQEEGRRTGNKALYNAALNAEYDTLRNPAAWDMERNKRFLDREPGQKNVDAHGRPRYTPSQLDAAAQRSYFPAVGHEIKGSFESFFDTLGDSIRGKNGEVTLRDGNGRPVRREPPKAEEGPYVQNESLRKAANYRALLSASADNAAERLATEASLSVLQNAPGYALAALYPAAGMAYIGAQAAGAKMDEVRANGGSVDEALVRGLISGGIEAGTEAIPLARLGGIFKGGGKGVLRNVAGQMATEATEESAAYLANLGADKIAGDPNASFSFGELAHNAALGAIAAGPMAGAASAVGAVSRPVVQAASFNNGEALRQAAQRPVSVANTQAPTTTTITQQTAPPPAAEPRTVQVQASQRPASVASQQAVPAAPRGNTPQQALQRPVSAASGQSMPRTPVGLDALVRRAQAAGADGRANVFTPAAQQAAPIRAAAVPPVRAAAGPTRTAAPSVSRVQAALDNAVNTLGENGRKAFSFAALPGTDPAAYFRGFAKVYNQALAGVKQAQVQVPGSLTPAQTEAAYASGQRDRTVKLENDRYKAQFASVYKGEDAGLVYDRYVETELPKQAAEEINQVAKALGKRVTFRDEVSGGVANAEIQGNEIRIERGNRNPVRYLFGHEITHGIQELAPEEYHAFRDYVMREDGVLDTVAEKVARYRAAGKDISQDQAMDEVAADYAGTLIEDEGLLGRFIQNNRENKSLLGRFLHAVKALAGKLTGRHKQAANRAADLLERAYQAATAQAKQAKRAENAAQTDGEARYSLKELDGEMMVVVDTENNTSDYKVAREYLKTLVNEEKPFSTILADAQTVYVGKDLPGEYTSSEYTKQMRSADRKIKLQAATNLDEMVLLAEHGEWRENVKEKHRKDAKNGWYHYETKFAVPIKAIDRSIDHYNAYSAELLIRNDENGKSYLYDLLDIKKERVISSTPSTATASGQGYSSQNPLNQGYHNNAEDVNSKSVADPSHSLKGSDYAAEKLAEENRALREQLDYWKRQTKRTTRQTVTMEPEGVQAVAEDLVRAYDMEDADVDTFTERLQALYNDYARSDWGPQEFADHARALAAQLVSPELGDAWTLRDKLEDGVPYDALAAEYPDLFDPLDSAEEQQARMQEVRDSLGETDADEAFTLDSVANDLLGAFLDLHQEKTAADVWAEKRREAVRKAKSKAKEREERKLQTLREHYAVRRGELREQRQARENRGKIVRHLSKLSAKLLRPSDKQHIPENLRTAVATLLDAVNLESKPRGKNPDAVTKRTEAFQQLREAYKAILEDKSGEVGQNMVVDPALVEAIDQVIQWRNTPLLQLSAEQTETIWQAVRMMEGSIRSANKAFGNARFQTIQEAAEGIRAVSMERGKKRELRGAMGELSKHTTVKMMTPNVFFARFGETGNQIYRMLRDARDQRIVYLKEASDFLEGDLGKIEAAKLSTQTRTFRFADGDVNLTTAQLMNLYALSKRPQALRHILEGGIRAKETGKERGLWRDRTVRPVHPTQDELLTVLGELTQAQKDFVDKLQDFSTNTLGGWGNKASMEVYNYKKFNEKNYWPLEVDKNSVRLDRGKEAQGATIAGWGHAKGVVPEAKNAVLVGDVFEVFTGQVAGMATYASHLGAMENLRRIYNFKFYEDGVATGTVQGAVESLLGKAGQDYWKQLDADLNGVVVKTEPGLFDGLMRNYKAAVIGGNLRVVLQQPTALARAGNMLSPVRLSAALAKNVAPFSSRSGWKEVQKYAPIALWKRWGYYDADIGHSMEEQLFHNGSLRSKAIDFFMKPIGVMDAKTWTAIWDAVKMEAAAKGFERGTDEFYQYAADRFADVIDDSQVVDGVLQKSHLMRNQNAAVRMATSFMSEPTKAFNMALDAAYGVQEAKGKGSEAMAEAGAKLGRAVLCLSIAGALTAAAMSIADALRDDDRDKSYWEKFLAHLTGLSGEEETNWDKMKSIFFGNLGSSLNPALQIPFIKDFFSLAEGYHVKRMDMEPLAALIRAFNTFAKAMEGEGLTRANAIANLLAAGANLLGLPVASLKRDILAIAQTTFRETGNLDMEYWLTKTLYQPNGIRKGVFLDIASDALAAGNTDLFGQIAKDMGLSVASLKKAVYDRDKKKFKELAAYKEKYNGIFDPALKTIQGTDAYKNMTPEQQEAVENRLKEYASSMAAFQASNGKYGITDEARNIQAIINAGYDLGNFLMLKTLTSGITGEKRESNGKDIKDSKSIKIRAVAEASGIPIPDDMREMVLDALNVSEDIRKKSAEVFENKKAWLDDVMSGDGLDAAVQKWLEGQGAEAEGESSSTTYSGAGDGTYHWPVKGYEKRPGPGSDFGPRNINVAGASNYHLGIDIGMPVGTPIGASRGGKVEGAGYNSARGNYIIVNHGDGTRTLYQHCDSISSKVGDMVNQGQTIAMSGHTGISGAPHLHFEVHVWGWDERKKKMGYIPVDPMQYLQ